MIKQSILIMVKNPAPGKVKTRLAATIGDEKAMAVYQLLLERTQAVTAAVDVERVVCYTDFIDEADGWERPIFEKALQSVGDLGQRMERAFEGRFEAGANQAVIIGSDCYQLDAPVLEQAFEALESHDLVIGPSLDGGYYLLGTKHLYPELFAGIAWSTPAVFEQTMQKALELQLEVYELPALRDVDHEADLVTIPDLEVKLAARAAG